MGIGAKRNVRIVLVMVFFGAAIGVSVEQAFAAWPGGNGRIVFHRQGTPPPDFGFFPNVIVTINSDGTGEEVITPVNENNNMPRWSADGTQIAFYGGTQGEGCAQDASSCGGDDIFFMNADGSGRTRVMADSSYNDLTPAWSPDGEELIFASNRGNYCDPPTTGGDYDLFVSPAFADAPAQQLTSTPETEVDPEFSPDGTKIAYTVWADCAFTTSYKIYIANRDGTGRTFLADGAAPSWSPDGTSIAFSTTAGVGVIGVDGTGEHILPGTQDAGGSRWSPDGKKMVFASSRYGNADIFVMNADGSGQTRITDDPAEEFGADWQPGAVEPTDPTDPSSTSLTIGKTRRAIDASGKVSPEHPGARMTVKLLRKRAGRFVVLSTKRPTLSGLSAYVARFDRPKEGACKVTVTFPGDDDHDLSRATRTFRC